MHKIMLVAIVVIATLHFSPTTDAFFITNISVQKGYPASSASSASPLAAIGALAASKNDLIQTVANVVTEKVNTITNLANSIVQAKINAKTNLLRTATSASSGIANSVNGILARKPAVTKTVTYLPKPRFVTTTAQTVPATIKTGAVVTTTGRSGGGYARYVRRPYLP